MHYTDTEDDINQNLHQIRVNRLRKYQWIKVGEIYMKQLVVDQVTTVLGKKELIKDISFHIDRGEVLALVGHNGAGKSTIMKTLMNMLDKHTGKVVIQENIDQDDNLLLYKKNISYLP